MSGWDDVLPPRACAGPGRQRTVAGTSIVVAAERWVPARGEWWLDCGLLDAPPEARELVHGPDDFTRPLSAEPPQPRTLLVIRAALATRDHVLETFAAVARELPWAQPGTSDYEREFGHIDRGRAAIRTLEALMGELRVLRRGS